MVKTVSALKIQDGKLLASIFFRGFVERSSRVSPFWFGFWLAASLVSYLVGTNAGLVLLCRLVSSHSLGGFACLVRFFYVYAVVFLDGHCSYPGAVFLIGTLCLTRVLFFYCFIKPASVFGWPRIALL